jgi:Regulator of ribonuclease activity B
MAPLAAQRPCSTDMTSTGAEWRNTTGRNTLSIPDYPLGPDGDALRRLAADGSDMSRPMEIDFAVAVPNESVGNAIAEQARGRGYAVKVVFDPGEDPKDDPPNRVAVAFPFGRR